MWIDLDYYKRRPLFLSDFQKKIAALPGTEKQEVRFLVTMNTQNQFRKLAFLLPKGSLLEEYHDLCRRYILAMLDNMIVSFGGASLDIYFDTSDKTLSLMLLEARAEFDLDRKDNCRAGHGGYINYVNRMNKFLKLGRFNMSLFDIRDWKELQPSMEFRLYEAKSEQNDIELLRRSALEMEGKCFCSLDVGGNSIKGAVVKDMEIAFTKEYQWFPTGIKTADEMNGHQLLMLRFLSCYTGAMEAAGGIDLADALVTSALVPDASYQTVKAAAEYLEAKGINPLARFDAVVIGFPDIVVFNKIAGGETFKQQGMKFNPDTDYETEFSKTSEFDNLARIYVKEGSVVIVLNDTNTASYLLSVEQSMAEKTLIDEHGMFANTVGTEMGTGFVSRGGTIQYIPLEGYQHVIDLGNTDYWKYPLNDLRSINNMNTGIPGTVQKYITQLGLFRMAMSGFSKAVIENMAEQKLIHYDPENDLVEMITDPINTREKLTLLLTKQMLSEKNPVMEEVFRTMGKAMGILIDQDLLLFPEIKPRRLISGGIMADDDVFRLFTDALKEHNPSYEIIRLDENTVLHPLLKKIPREKRNFTVAVGSAFIGNRFLLSQNEDNHE